MGCSRGRGGAARGKGKRLTLRCSCRVVGLGQLGSRHVVGNGRFRGHSVCTLYNSDVISCGVGSRVGSLCVVLALKFGCPHLREGGKCDDVTRGMDERCFY